MDGVASYCRPCALEASDVGSSCTSCPAGYYIDRDSGTCHSCPTNTILKVHQPYGAQACMSCGPGTKSNQVLAVLHASLPWAFGWMTSEGTGSWVGSRGSDYPSAPPNTFPGWSPGCSCGWWILGSGADFPQSWKILVFSWRVREMDVYLI